MPYIVTTVAYPSEKSTQVAERYLEILKEYPQDDTLTSLVVPAYVKASIEGVKAISISEVKEGRLEEAWARARNMAYMFIDVEGVEYSLDLLATASEGFASLGMNLPG